MLAEFKALNIEASEEFPDSTAIHVMAEIVEIRAWRKYKTVTLISKSGNTYHIYCVDYEETEKLEESLLKRYMIGTPIQMQCFAVVDCEGVVHTKKIYTTAVKLSTASDKSVTPINPKSRWDCKEGF